MCSGFCLAPQFGQTARSFPFFFAAPGAAVLAIRFAIRRPGLQSVQGTPSIMPAVHLHLATSGSAVLDIFALPPAASTTVPWLARSMPMLRGRGAQSSSRPGCGPRALEVLLGEPAERRPDMALVVHGQVLSALAVDVGEVAGGHARALGVLQVGLVQNSRSVLPDMGLLEHESAFKGLHLGEDCRRDLHLHVAGEVDTHEILAFRRRFAGPGAGELGAAIGRADFASESCSRSWLRGRHGDSPIFDEPSIRPVT